MSLFGLQLPSLQELVCLRLSSRSFSGKSAVSPPRSRHRVLPSIPDARDHIQTPFIPVWRMSGIVCFAEVCSEAMELFMQFAFALYSAHAMCFQRRPDTETESANSQHFLCALGTFVLHVSLKPLQARLGPALLLNERRRKFPVPRVGRSGSQASLLQLFLSEACLMDA